MGEASGQVLDRRRAGVILHPTSLPGPGPRGTLGEEAHRFLEFLAAAGLTVWQVLPLGPTHEDGSPYMGLSVHAGDPRLVDLSALRAAGWLEGEPPGREAALEAARRGFAARADEAERAAYARFRARHAHWLEDYVLYEALRREKGGASWVDWPVPERDRRPEALAAARRRLAEALETGRFTQFVFYRQWGALREHAGRLGVRLLGDMPIFVAHDSADVWAHREYFKLDAAGRPTVVAGVPPDYFSATGQRWGNPHYRWEAMAADGYRWWVERLGTALELFDLVRVDHFRGFEACWEIPAAAETAVEGRWVKVDGAAVFDALRAAFGRLPLVAEDLGIITPEVEALRDRYGLPGMKVLQFAFDGGAHNPYLPHNYGRNHVVYTGTHDNDTSLGWWRGLSEPQRERVLDYLGRPGEPMPWPLLRCAFASTALLAMAPMQDFLGLGSEHRMNRPGVPAGNWRWRFDWAQVPQDLAARLRHLAALYGRA